MASSELRFTFSQIYVVASIQMALTKVISVLTEDELTSFL